MQKPVYLRVKPEKQKEYNFKYIVYGIKNDEIGNIVLYKKPYAKRCLVDSY